MRVCLFRHSREKRSQAIARLGTLPIDWQGATGWVYVRWGEVRLGCGGSAVADPPDSTIDADAERLPPTKENWVNGLQRFERRLERLVSDAFAKAFRSAVQPVEIAAALQRECDNNAQILSRQRRLVPNDFHVELAQSDLDRLAPYDTAMAAELEKQVTEHALHDTVIWSGWFHRRAPAALAVVWPDRRGIFAWQPGAPAVLDDEQPPEWRVPAPRTGALAVEPPWPFALPPEHEVVTCTHVIERGDAVLRVWRGAADDSDHWIFDCGDPDHQLDEMALAHLAHLVRGAPGIRALGDLAPGAEARRADADARWVRRRHRR